MIAPTLRLFNAAPIKSTELLMCVPVGVAKFPGSRVRQYYTDPLAMGPDGRCAPLALERPVLIARGHQNLQVVKFFNGLLRFGRRQADDVLRLLGKARVTRCAHARTHGPA